jgi:hypothetical protein
MIEKYWQIYMEKQNEIDDDVKKKVIIIGKL